MPRLNDIGTVFRMTITKESDASALDISAATTRQIYFKKPSGEVDTRTATLSGSGTDGRMQYATVDGDLDEVGQWEIQGKVVIGTQTFKTKRNEFEVEKVNA